MKMENIIARGWKAIELAKTNPEIQLNKHTDPIGDYMEDISIELAEEVAREDDNLIFAVERI